MSKWSSYDSVDWAYFGPGFNGSGFLYGARQYDDSPPHFTIHGFAGRFNAATLHQILWATQKQFPELQLRCLYRGAQAEQLEQLAREGLVSWCFSNHQHQREAEILSVQQPTSDRPYIHSLPIRMLNKLKEFAGPKT